MIISVKDNSTTYWAAMSVLIYCGKDKERRGYIKFDDGDDKEVWQRFVVANMKEMENLKNRR